jgi:hypothetical protein
MACGYYSRTFFASVQLVMATLVCYGGDAARSLSVVFWAELIPVCSHYRRCVAELSMLRVGFRATGNKGVMAHAIDTMRRLITASRLHLEHDDYYQLLRDWSNSSTLS